MPLRCIAQSHSFDQAVEEAGRSSPLPHLSDHGFVDACRKVRTLRPNDSPVELGRRARHRPHRQPWPQTAKSHKTPPADAPPQRRLASRVIAPARARAVPRLAVARFATESEVVEVRDDGVVVPELVETLEWVLDSPPPLHQFEESPIIVEIAGIEPAASR